MLTMLRQGRWLTDPMLHWSPSAVWCSQLGSGETIRSA
jgi:hypothetical protein